MNMQSWGVGRVATNPRFRKWSCDDTIHVQRTWTNPVVQSAHSEAECYRDIVINLKESEQSNF